MFAFGIKPLDNLLGGGVPAGITDIFGEPSTGKTTLGACLLRQASTLGRPCVLITADPSRYTGLPDLPVVQVSTWSALAETIGELVIKDLLVVVDRPLESSINAGKGLAEQDYQEGYQEIIDALCFMHKVLMNHSSSLVLLSEARQDGFGIRSAIGKADREVDAQICLKQVSSTMVYGVTTLRKILFRVCRNKARPPGGTWEFVLHRKDGVDPGLEHLRYLIETGAAIPVGSRWKLENTLISGRPLLGPGYKLAAEQLTKLALGPVGVYNEKGHSKDQS